MWWKHCFAGEICNHDLAFSPSHFWSFGGSSSTYVRKVGTSLRGLSTDHFLSFRRLCGMVCFFHCIFLFLTVHSIFVAYFQRCYPSSVIYWPFVCVDTPTKSSLALVTFVGVYIRAPLGRWQSTGWSITTSISCIISPGIVLNAIS